MRKKIFKISIFYIINISVIILFGIVFKFSINQWLLIFFGAIIVSIVDSCLIYFWLNQKNSELEIMKNRMAMTRENHEPRGVVAEDRSPHYALINEFNELQNYIKQMKLNTERDINNYQSLLSSLPVGVINVNRRHIIDVFNETAAQLLGMHKPEVPIAESIVIRQFTLSELINQTFNTKKNQQSILNLQINGETKQYDVSTLYRSSDIQNAEVMIILYDLTTLLQIEQMQSDFLANASHELKTPLTAITGFIETLQGPAGQDTATRAQFLQIVADESHRLSSLVNDILSLSHAQQRDGKDQTYFSVKNLVSEQWQQIKTLFPEKKVILHNNIDENFNINSIYTEISAILQNLIVNAVKYNVLNGSITVQAKKNQQNWELEVSDTGIGIPTNQQSRIFERFYRGDESRQRTIASGTGLGLAIVNEIVTKHNGQIKVTSQVGVGTTITIILPL
ncbi:sensor histidine kinase [Leuconostoc palmae]|uniref:sensor histidine kinase n=1 Tax=Leuconostoc palmae TaxID=501487 RepID=UPI001C7DB74B|nr:ATP-binding protein [Leuconostoc palmae]